MAIISSLKTVSTGFFSVQSPPTVLPKVSDTKEQLLPKQKLPVSRPSRYIRIQKKLFNQRILNKVWKAVENNDKKYVENKIGFLRETKQLESKNSNDLTIFLCACFWNASDVVPVLMEHGANVLAEDKYGNNALERALSSQRKSTLRMLLKKEYFPKLLPADHLKTIDTLQRFIRFAKVELPDQLQMLSQYYFEVLIENLSPSPSELIFIYEECFTKQTVDDILKFSKLFTWLWDWFAKNSEDFSEKTILSALQVLQEKTLLSSRPHRHQLLCALLKQDKISAAKILIESGAGEPEDTKKETAFQIALRQKQLDIAEFLQKKCDKKCLVDPRKEYWLAELAGFPKISEFIDLTYPSTNHEKLFALTRLSDEDLDRLLTLALKQDYPFSSVDSLAIKLIELGALSFEPVKTEFSGFEAILKTKNSVLISASIQALGKRKKLDQKDTKGRTPLMLAVQFDDEKAITELVDKGASFLGHYSEGATIFTLSTWRGKKDILKILCDAKKQHTEVLTLLNEPGENDKTPFALAVEHNRKDIYDLYANTLLTHLHTVKVPRKKDSKGCLQITCSDNSTIKMNKPSKINCTVVAGEVFECTHISADGKKNQIAGKKQIVYVDKDEKTSKKYLERKKLAIVNFLDVEREKTIHKRLSHPSIVSYFGDAYYEGKHAIKNMMGIELGIGSFNVLINQDWGDKAFRVETIKNLLEALEYIHGQGILHRDIKPKNLVVVVLDQKTGQKKIKLGDFGLAETRVGVKNIGTKGYVAPDALSTTKSDIFCFGVTAFEMLYGNKLSKPNHAINTFLYSAGEPQKVSIDHLIWQMTSLKPQERPEAKIALELLKTKSF